MTHWQAVKTFLGMALVAIIILAGSTLLGRADERREFFDASRNADLRDGRKGYNCCGPGDAVRVRIIGGSPGVLAAEIIDPMRHAYAKVGEVVTVPVGVIAKRPHAPQSLGNVLFLSLNPIKEGRRVYCLMPQSGG